jgi:ribosomal protein L11 methyltransferase
MKPDSGTILLDALTAFGAGDHPSTRLNLWLLDACFQEKFQPEPGLWLADVGAGTGILSLGLALLYARPVLALDPEPASLRAVRRNLELNPLARPWVHFALGYHHSLAGPFGLMACNMPGAIILDALPILARSLAKGARVVFSGFRDQMAPEIIESSQKQGLLLHNEAHDQDWAGLCLTKS